MKASIVLRLWTILNFVSSLLLEIYVPWPPIKQTMSNEANQDAYSYLMRECEDLRKECCTTLSLLLPTVSAQRSRRESPPSPKLATNEEIRAAASEKDPSDSSPSAQRRIRGALKKARRETDSDFAIDDLSLTLAVATLLKALYTALDADSPQPSPVIVTTDAWELSPSTLAAKIAVDRLVTAIAKKEGSLNFADFLELQQIVPEPAPPSADVALATSAAMYPVQDTIRQMPFTGMTEGQQMRWKEVDKAISLVLSITEMRWAFNAQRTGKVLSC